MSKLSDYSKFDRLDDDDDDESDEEPRDELQPQQQSQQQRQRQPQPQPQPQGQPQGSPSPVTAPPEAIPPVATVTAAVAAVAAVADPATETTASSSSSSSNSGTMRKDPSSGRFIFEYDGREVYQWEQTLDDVTVYIQAPPHVQKANQINLKIQASHLKLGLAGSSTWFLDEPTFGKVDVSESTWSLEEDEDDEQRHHHNHNNHHNHNHNNHHSSGGGNQGLTKRMIIAVYLTKAHRGQLWDAALQGNRAVQLDPAAKEDVKKELMLERFQEEHPGFDFRDATFNGSVPEPRSFMGGVKYS